MGPHRSSLVKTCMGPPNVQPAFHNTQQRNQQQAMQAVVEAQHQQLQQAAQHHHHQMHLQMQQQAFHQQMQHHMAQQQQQQHQQEPPLSRAGSSSSASSSGSSSLETCSPPSSPTDSATVAHRNGDADRKTYAAAPPQSVAPPTTGMSYFLYLEHHKFSYSLSFSFLQGQGHKLGVLLLVQRRCEVPVQMPVSFGPRETVATILVEMGTGIQRHPIVP